MTLPLCIPSQFVVDELVSFRCLTSALNGVTIKALKTLDLQTKSSHFAPD